MGLTAIIKVIIRAEYYGQCSLLQPRNCEWVTVIEYINALGWALSLCVIFKGKSFIKAWFNNIPSNWQFEVSPNDWTSNKIGICWLEKLFISLTTSCTKGKY